MANTDTFVINYDPLERMLRFAIVKSSGVRDSVHDGEQLKDYENNDGIFTLVGVHEKLFAFIKENFDGKAEISLRVDVPQHGFDKYPAEFEYFKQCVEKFNKNSEIKINLTFDIQKDTAEQVKPEAVSTIETPTSNLEAANLQNVIPTKITAPLKIAVVGKIMSGKTELIHGLTKHNNSVCSNSLISFGTTKYDDATNSVEWYELAGIELGKENVDRARDVLENLITDHGISIVLYCLHSKTGKIEDIERDFIVNVKQKYPSVVVYAVITACIDENASRDFAEKVSSSTKRTEVFTVLAKEMRTNVGYLEPFGLEEMTKSIFGG